MWSIFLCHRSHHCNANAAKCLVVSIDRVEGDHYLADRAPTPLCDELWAASLQTRQNAFETQFVQGMESAKLDPTDFGRDTFTTQRLFIVNLLNSHQSRLLDVVACKCDWWDQWYTDNRTRGLNWLYNTKRIHMRLTNMPTSLYTMNFFFNFRFISESCNQWDIIERHTNNIIYLVFCCISENIVPTRTCILCVFIKLQVKSSFLSQVNANFVLLF